MRHGGGLARVWALLLPPQRLERGPYARSGSSEGLTHNWERKSILPHSVIFCRSCFSGVDSPEMGCMGRGGEWGVPEPLKKEACVGAAWFKIAGLGLRAELLSQPLAKAAILSHTFCLKPVAKYHNPHSAVGPLARGWGQGAWQEASLGANQTRLRSRFATF